ncbi:predicted protein [Chaetoceros tenuissimus]|uniref:Uncharacterized protein n=1 Tax=Chaetoceros tenuissimus TaxID=426638 RepID=A0AAD3CQD0_9STRA|nr:predicted protein [Chaetoceros tenuissimus]
MRSIETTNIPDPGEFQEDEEIPYVMGLEETIVGRAQEIQADRLWTNNIQKFPKHVMQSLKERLEKTLGNTSANSSSVALPVPMPAVPVPAQLQSEETEVTADFDELKREVEL